MNMEEEARLAQPDPIESMKIEAWYMDDSNEDQRRPHKLRPCSPKDLAAVGILTWHMDADAYPECPKLKAIRKARGYDYEDIVNISPDTLSGYEEKIKSFYEEHIHSDEEIRCVLDGSGYFDVRDKEDKWIRIWTRKGDLIALPEGIYHRFTLDEKNYIKALRLFCGVPIWTPYNRPQEEHPSRIKYVDEYKVLTAVAAQ